MRIFTLLIALMFAALSMHGQVPGPNLNEGFEDGVIPDNWTVLNEDGGSYNWEAQTLNPNSGTYAARVRYESFSLDNDDWLITPPLWVTSSTTDEISFWMRTYSSTSADPWEVLVSTTDTNPASFTMIDSGPGMLGSYVQKTYSLDAYGDAIVYVAIRYIGSYDWYLYVDDFVGPPVVVASCPEPTNLSVQNITTTSADLNWTAGGDEDLWNLEWGLAGFAQGTGTLVSGIITNTYNLSGLTLLTDYEFYVQADCGTKELSDWSGPLAFQTLGNPLSGNYTINSTLPTGGINFANFTDFATAINSGGFAGPVVVDVVTGTGPYNEQVMLGELPNSSAVNTLNINGNGETLEYLSTNTNERATLKFDGTDYVTVNNLIVKALGEITSPAEYGWAVWLTNEADYNTFNDCQFIASTTATSSNFAGFVTSNNSTGATTASLAANNLTVEDCTATGGYYGMIINGPTSAPYSVNNTIVNNQVTDFHLYGLYLRGQNNSIITDNVITRPTRTTTGSLYMLYVTQNMSGTTIMNNQVYDFSPSVASTSTAYGIYGTSISANPGEELLIANNVIFGLQNMNGTQYGMYMLTTDNTKFYHNSISLDNVGHTGSSLIRGLHHTGNLAIIEFINNIISVTSNSTGTKYCMYFSQTEANVPLLTSDNNVLHMGATAGTNHLVYWKGDGGTNYTALADWQLAASGAYDQNSVDDDPAFTSPLLTPTSPAVNDIGTDALLAIVPNDIFGVARGTDPDPGAIEFDPPDCFFPTDLAADNITTTQADLSWTDNNTPPATSWDLELGPAGFTPSGTPTQAGVTNPYTYTGLDPATTYDWYVRADCGAKAESPWAGPHSFTTLCDAFTVFPYEQGFEDEFPPLCWTVVNGVAGSYWQQTTVSKNSGTFSARSYNGSGSGYLADEWMITPAFDLGAKTSYWMKFSGYSSQAPNGDKEKMRIMLLDDVYDNVVDLHANATEIAVFYFTGTWEEYVVDLSAYTGEKYLAFNYYITENVGFNWIYIDDVLIEPMPDCIEPTDLTVNNITSASAVLGWTPFGSESLWNVEVGLPGFTPGTVTHVLSVTGVATNTYEATGLDPQTEYDFYVQADCGNGEKEVSTWSGPHTFTTLCEAFTVFPYEQGFEDEFPPLCWTVVNGVAGSYWQQTTASKNSGTYSARSYNGYSSDYLADEWMISPAFDLDIASNLRMKFYGYSNQAPNGAKEKMRIMLLDQMYDNVADLHANAIELEVFYFSQSWQEYMVDLFAYTGIKYVAFNYHITENVGYNYVYIDDAEFYEVPLGTLSGVVTRATSKSPIQGARVYSGVFEGFTDEFGLYQIDEFPVGTHTIYCEADGYITSVVEDFEILNTATNTLDFVLDYAEISVDPTSLTQTVEPGGTATQSLTISNPAGTATLTWDANIAEGVGSKNLSGYNSNYNVQPGNFELPVGNDRNGSVITGNSATPVIVPETSTALRSSFSEGFDDVTLLPGMGWAFINNSDPIGVGGWFQGNTDAFIAYDGADDAYIGVNFESGDGASDLSNWMLTPEITFNNGDSFSFWTRTPTGSIWADRLEVRMSTQGGSTDVGNTATSVGDFTTVLLTINPDLLQGVYPEVWTQYTVTISGLSEATNGRIAFRYFVTDGGPFGTNSNYIGIDSFEYTATSSAVTWLSIAPTSGTVPPGGNAIIQVDFDSEGLLEDTYLAEIMISHNGQQVSRGEISVPVTFEVLATVAPAQASGPDPENGTIGVSVQPVFSWTNGAGTIESKFHIYKDGKPVYESVFFTGNSFDFGELVGSLEGNALFNWWITCKNSVGETMGPVWSFTTIGIGSIEGTVTDAYTANPLEAVVVAIEGSAQTAATNAAGLYQITGLPIGSYTLTFTKEGYFSNTKVIEVLHGQAADGDIELYLYLDPPIGLQATVYDIDNVALTWVAPFVFEPSGRLQGNLKLREAKAPIAIVVQQHAEIAEPSEFKPVTFEQVVVPLSSNKSVLHDNGPLVNTECFTTNDPESMIQDPTTSPGFNFNKDAGYTVADDFTVPEGVAWGIETVELFGYQTLSTVTPTFTGAYIRIWSGEPGNGGSVIWGDLETNLMTSAEFTGIYRVSQTTSCNTDRPIMRIVAGTPDLALPSGTYWIEFGTTGSLGSGPWVPPVYENDGSFLGNNAKQFTGAWVDLMSGPAGEEVSLEVPFVLNGSTGSASLPENLTGFNVYRDGSVIANVPAQARTLNFGYDDGPLAQGLYSYEVTAVYGGDTPGESDPDGPVLADVITCFPPSDLYANDITATNALLGWAPGFDEPAWNVEIGLPGFEPGAGEASDLYYGVATNTLTVYDLNPATDYEFYVQSACGEARLESAWVGPHAFSTMQIPGTMPFTEDFEIWPNGWNVVNGAQVNQWRVGTATAYQGLQSAYISNDDGITNAYNVNSSSVVHLYRDIEFEEDMMEFELTFWWKGIGETVAWDRMRIYLVETSVEPLTGAELLLSNQIGLSNYNGQSTWNQDIITLPGELSGETMRLVFSWRNDAILGTQPPVAIDDISLVAIPYPPCPNPTAFAASNITTSSVDLNWTPGGNELSWQVEVGSNSFEPGTGAHLFSASGIITNTITIGTLSPSFTYEAYVKGNCPDEEDSEWVGPVEFTTLCEPFTEDFCEGFESETAPPDCWTMWYANPSPPAGNLMTHSTVQFLTGTRSFRFSSFSSGSPYDQYLQTPELDFADDKLVSFSYRRHTSGSETFTVGTSNDGINYDWSANVTDANTTWQEFSMVIPAGTKFVAIHYKSVYEYYLYVDDFCIEEIRYPVTFNVDVTTIDGFDPDIDDIYLAGNFPDAVWNEPGTNPDLLMQPGAVTDVYTLTLDLPAGTYEYKYFRNAGWDGGEWAGGDNRSIFVDDEVSICDVFGGAIAWANLQWPDVGNITEGDSYNVYGQVHIPNITGIVSPGYTYVLEAWVGISETDTDPSGWSNWVQASFSSDAGNNDEFVADIAGGLEPGTYYYAYRYRFGEICGSYLYGGYNGGFWNGVDNVSGELVVNADGPPSYLFVDGIIEDCLNALDEVEINGATVENGAIADIRSGGIITATAFNVEAGGTAYLTAANSIVMNPDVLIAPGATGLFHAKIGVFEPCALPAAMVASEEVVIPEEIPELPGNDSFFRVFPNPTTSTFKLEFLDADQTSTINVEIYGMMGERVFQNILFGAMQYEFDLSNMPNGIYFIRVLKGDEMGIEKVIKQ